jgi:hypothetical protein
MAVGVKPAGSDAGIIHEGERGIPITFQVNAVSTFCKHPPVILLLLSPIVARYGSENICTIVRIGSALVAIQEHHRNC